MLDNAFKYEDKIRARFLDVWYDPKYQFYFCGAYHEPFSLPQNGDWHCRQFVSLSKEGEVNGLIGYAIDHDCNLAHNFGAINFSTDRVGFGLDLARCIDDIFVKFCMNKLEFNVICGNPIEASYDKIIGKIGGHILCTRRDRAKDMAGNFHDDKIYEVMREDYMKAKERRRHHGS